MAHSSAINGHPNNVAGRVAEASMSSPSDEQEQAHERAARIIDNGQPRTMLEKVGAAMAPRSEGRCQLSIFDDIKGKAEGLINGHADQIKDGVEKAGDFVDSKTGNKFKDQIDTAQKAAGDYVDRSSQ